MATRDSAQLILQVDAQIASAQRALNQLARSVNSDAASMDKALNGVAQSLNDNNNRMRNGFTQLSFQIGDVTQQMSLGVSGARIFAQQSGQVIQALQIMGGEGNKFLRFLGGPWGIAISTAAVILAPLASKLFETGDEVGKLVEKMREQARQSKLNREADELWKGTIEGLTEAIRKRREEQEKARKSDVTAEAESFAAARGELGGQVKNLEDKTRDLQKAMADLKEARKLFKSVEGTEFAAGALTAVLNAEAKVKSIRGEVQGITKDVRDAQQNLRGEQAKILTRDAEQALDPLKKTTDQIAVQIDQLTERFTKGQIGPAAYRKEIEKLTKALKDAKDAGKSVSSGLSGRQVDFQQATQIARSAGLQVNSGYRSNAEQAALYNNPSVNRPGNPVAKPGSSAHNGAGGKWAIDIQITDGVTPQKIRKVFADQGVSLTKVLKEKGHFHIEGSRSEAAAADKSAETAAARQVRQDNSFEEQRDKLNQELLRAQNDLVEGIDGQADVAIETLQAEQSRRAKAIQNDVEEGKLSQAQADELKVINGSITIQKAKAVELQRQLQHMQQADEQQQRTFQYQIDDLRFADEMAKTAAEHRRLQLDIVDILYAQKEAHLRAQKAELELAGKIEEAAAVQAQIDRLPTERAQDHTRATQGTRGPLESYFADVPRTAEETAEAMERLKVQGIDGAINSILALRGGFDDMRDTAIRAIEDIIAALIRMQLMKLAMSLIGGATGGPAGALGGGTSYASSSALGGFDFSGVPGMAMGGIIAIGGRSGVDRNVLSINGIPRARVSANEHLAVIPNTPRVRTARSGDNYHISVAAPNTGDPRRDRRTSLQQAADIKMAIASASRKGA